MVNKPFFSEADNRFLQKTKQSSIETA